MLLFIPILKTPPPKKIANCRSAAIDFLIGYATM